MVGKYAGGIREPEERVIGEDARDTQSTSGMHGLVGERRAVLVRVNDVNRFAQCDGTHERRAAEGSWQRRAPRHLEPRRVVHLGT